MMVERQGAEKFGAVLIRTPKLRTSEPNNSTTSAKLANFLGIWFHIEELVHSIGVSRDGQSCRWMSDVGRNPRGVLYLCIPWFPGAVRPYRSRAIQARLLSIYYETGAIDDEMNLAANLANGLEKLAGASKPNSTK